MLATDSAIPSMRPIAKGLAPLLPAFLALSPDDHSLYVAAAGDASVFSFERER